MNSRKFCTPGVWRLVICWRYRVGISRVGDRSSASLLIHVCAGCAFTKTMCACVLAVHPYLYLHVSVLTVLSLQCVCMCVWAVLPYSIPIGVCANHALIAIWVCVLAVLPCGICTRVLIVLSLKHVCVLAVLPYCVPTPVCISCASFSTRACVESSLILVFVCIGCDTHAQTFMHNEWADYAIVCVHTRFMCVLFVCDCCASIVTERKVCVRCAVILAHICDDCASILTHACMRWAFILIRAWCLCFRIYTGVLWQCLHDPTSVQ